MASAERQSAAAPTFADALAASLTKAVARGLEPATLRMYRYYTVSFLVPALGDRPVASLEPTDLESLYERMISEGYAPSSVRKCHVIASGALKYAERQGWVPRNVARMAELPKTRPIDRTIPTPEAVTRFVAAAAQVDRDIHDYALILAASGMRPGEACGLMTTDLDERGVLTISRAVDVCEGMARLKSTKTGKVRRITLDPATLTVFRARPGPYVFGGSEPGRTDLLSKRFKRIAQNAGVSFTPRSLRHFHATQLLASGKLSVRQVADRLGHASPMMTLNVYSQAVPALDALAADVIGDVLRGNYELPEGEPPGE